MKKRSLPNYDINQIKVELMNTKKMYESQKETNLNLKNKNKNLVEENNKLSLENKKLSEEKEKLELQIEEYKRMIFKKTTKEKDNINEKGNWKIRNKKTKERTKSSYRRQIPDESKVTKNIYFEIQNCNECWTKLTRKKHLTRYLEDIILPTVDKIPALNIEKHIVGVWYCSKCHKRKKAKVSWRQRVEIWENVKILVWYMIAIMRLTFSQTRTLIKDLFWMKFSDWEITIIQREHAWKLSGEFENIKERIWNQKWNHIDETTWKVQKETENDWWYCWILKWTETSEVIYLLWKNRWKFNAEELIKWASEEMVWITDDYWAYKNIFKYHQLCWAHPHRKLRDLANSWILDKLKIEICKTTYEAFSKLYKDLKENLTEPFNIEKNLIIKNKFIERFEEISKIIWNEPEKLKKIKESLIKNKQYYFTCLEHEWIPCDNNEAERSIRHIVLKRKNSFWSKTSVGAKTMSILYSVLISYRNKDPNKFFDEYKRLLENH